MKQVLFVCLLTLSVCLGQTNQQQPASPTTVGAPNVTPPAEKATETKPDHAVPTTPQTVATEATTAPPANTTQISTAPENNTVVVPPKESSTKANESKPADKDNTTGNKAVTDPPKTAGDKTTIAPKNETKPAVPSDKMNNGTNADNKDGKKNETVTPKNEIVTSTEAPVQAKTRAFDGPSFIGGIVLALGLLAIGFMGFKYYKNQTERNYHTL